MLKSRMWQCPGCHHHFDALIADKDRDEGVECPICHEECSREHEVLTAPNVTRATRVDGSTKDSTKRLIEASKLESKMFDMPVKKRGDIKKEIRKLKSTDSKGKM